MGCSCQIFISFLFLTFCYFYHNPIVPKRQIPTEKQFGISDLDYWFGSSSLLKARRQQQISVYVQSRYSCRMFAQTLQDIQRAETVPAADSHAAALWITHTTTLIVFIFVSHTVWQCASPCHSSQSCRSPLKDNPVTSVLDCHSTLQQERQLQTSI